MILDSILYLGEVQGKCYKDIIGLIDKTANMDDRLKYRVNVTFTEIDNCTVYVREYPYSVEIHTKVFRNKLHGEVERKMWEGKCETIP